MTVQYAEMFGNLLNDIRNNDAYCPVCKKHFPQLEDQAFIRYSGMCVSCDDIRGEIDRELYDDAEEMEEYATITR